MRVLVAVATLTFLAGCATDGSPPISTTPASSHERIAASLPSSITNVTDNQERLEAAAAANGWTLAPGSAFELGSAYAFELDNGTSGQIRFADGQVTYPGGPATGTGLNNYRILRNNQDTSLPALLCLSRDGADEGCGVVFTRGNDFFMVNLTDTSQWLLLEA